MAARLCNPGQGGGGVLADQASYSAAEHIVDAELIGQLDLKRLWRSLHRIRRPLDEPNVR